MLVLPRRGGAWAKVAAAILVAGTVTCLVAAAATGPWWYVWRAWGVAILAAAAGCAAVWSLRVPRIIGPGRTVASDERAADAVSALVDLMDHLPTEALRQRVGQALAAAGVSAFGADGEAFDPRRHMIIAVESTTDAALDRHVARTVGPGYASAGGILKPARVSLYQIDTARPAGRDGAH